MRKFIIFLLLALAIALSLVLVLYQRNSPNFTRQTNSQKNSFTMKIISPAFTNNGKIPSKYTCDGEDVSPPLEFLEVPREAKSLVLIVDDPDAPGKTWVHWVVYNISPSTGKVLEDSIPQVGVLGKTDFDTLGYGGPCPPSGTHRYFFKLYAIKKGLDLSEGLNKQQILEKINESVIEQAQIIGLYSRK